MRYIVLPALLALAGCGTEPRVPPGMQTGASATTTVSPDFDRAKRRVAVLPFVNSATGGPDYAAAEKFAGRLEGLGFKITGSSATEAACRELLVDPARELSLEYLSLLAGTLGVDYLLTGTVHYARDTGYSYSPVNEYGFTGGPGRERLDGQSLRLRDAATGEVVLSSFCCDKEYYGQSIAAELAESVGRALFPERYKTSFRP